MDWHTADLHLFRWVNGTHSWWLDWLLVPILWLGELGFLWVVVTLLLWRKRSRWAPYFTYLLLGTAFLNNAVIHSLTFRARPYMALDNVRLLGWPWDGSSFVSGQAILAVASAVVVHHAFPQWRRLVWVLTALTLYSRVYAGMHYPLDVLVGALVGLALGWSALAAERNDLWTRLVAWARPRWARMQESTARALGDTRRRAILLGALVLVLLAVSFIWLSWFGVWLTLALVLGNVLLYAVVSALLRLLAGRRPKLRKATRAVTTGAAVLLFAECAFFYTYIWRYAIDRAPLPGDRYVVVIVADGASLVKAKEMFLQGAGSDDYWKSANENYPTIARYFIQEGAYTANGISVWPSSSIPAHTGIVAGSYPRNTDVVGQRQFDRATRKHTSYIGLGILEQRNILKKERKTLYEYFPDSRSLVVLQVVNRGCSFFVPCSPSDQLALKRIGQVYGLSNALGRLSGRNELPRLLIVTLPDVDHQTHSKPLSDEKITALYRDLDRSVSVILDLYRRRGIYDKTLFVLAADHGMGQVEKHVTLDNLVHDLRFDSFASLKWSVNPAWGSFEANTFVGTRYRFEHVNNAIPLWGGNSDGALYIKGQKLDSGGKVLRETWDIKPSDDSLHHYVVGDVKVDVIGRLLEYSPGIGLISTQAGPGDFRVYGQEGAGRLQERQRDGATEFKYTVTAGSDPLMIREPAAREAIRQGKWLSDARWLDLLYLEHYPDALRRVGSALGSRYSADMNIVAADGWDLTPYYASPHVLVGSHGSLNQDQSYVPIMFHGPGITPGEMPYARTVDILPTILAYLGKDVRGLPLDGRVLPVFRGAPIIRYDVGEAVLEPPAAAVSSWCKLSGLYGSYDRQLMIQRDGQWQVLIPSLRAHLKADKVNVTYDHLEWKGDPSGQYLTVQKRYMGENRPTETVRLVLP